MDKYLELQRQLDIETMELEQRIARFEADERMLENTIVTMKADLFKLQAALVVHNNSPSYSDIESHIDELRLKIQDEKIRLLEIQTRKRETKIGGESRKTEFLRNIEIEKSKDKFQSFMGNLGLVRK